MCLEVCYNYHRHIYVRIQYNIYYGIIEMCPSNLVKLKASHLPYNNKTQLQLENECKKLRAELQQKSELNHISTKTREQLLDRIRGERQRQDEAGVTANCEMERLRQLHAKTLVFIYLIEKSLIAFVVSISFNSLKTD